MCRGRRTARRAAACRRPGRGFGVVSAKCSESGSRNASRRDAVLARAHPDRSDQPLGVRHSQRGQQPVGHRGGSHRSPIAAIRSEASRIRASSAAERKNGRSTGQWTRSPNVSFDRASRRRATAEDRRQLVVGPQQPGPLRDGIHYRTPGAPVKPVLGPSPIISSQRPRLRRQSVQRSIDDQLRHLLDHA